MRRFVAPLLLLLIASTAMAQKSSALIREALDKQLSKTKIDFKGTLPQIITEFGDLTSVPIQADNTVYDALPWGELTTFSAKFENETLRQALGALCQKLGLEFQIGKETVELRPLPALKRLGRRCTVEELAALDLLSATPLAATDLHPTIGQLLATIDAKLEKSPYAIESRAFDAADKSVINLARNASLMDALEEIAAQTNATWYPWGKTIVIVKKPDQIRMQLGRRITTRFNGVDVGQVLLELSERSGIDFQIDPGTFAKLPAGVRMLKLTLDNATIQQALEQISGFTGLQYSVTDKGVAISIPSTTTPTTAPSP